MYLSKIFNQSEDSVERYYFFYKIKRGAPLNSGTEFGIVLIKGEEDIVLQLHVSL